MRRPDKFSRALRIAIWQDGVIRRVMSCASLLFINSTIFFYQFCLSLAGDFLDIIA